MVAMSSTRVGTFVCGFFAFLQVRVGGSLSYARCFARCVCSLLARSFFRHWLTATSYQPPHATSTAASPQTPSLTLLTDSTANRVILPMELMRAIALSRS